MAVETILIVDDSATDRAFLVGILKKAGFQCFEAESGTEGVAKAKSKKPDLILLDVIMPGLNGFETARILQRDDETKSIPIFICTTKDQATDKVWGMRQGATHYLVKPIVAEDLVAKVRAIA
jgi:twitching motility two-component system response regulator PilH